MAKTIREAVAERGDSWVNALEDDKARTAHTRNETLAIVGSEAERSDFYVMRSIQSHPSDGVRQFYREGGHW